MRGDLVYGHRVNGIVIEFPHRCPGDGCAIAAFLHRQFQRGRYERVIPETTAEQDQADVAE
jgi:hypothetical protein